MSFGELQLKKYGWEKGKGLGREENGICNALRPKLKFNTAGLGHDQSEEFTFQWWDHVYNKAANNLSVQKNKGGKIEIVKSDDLHLSTKKSSLMKSKTSSGYGNFVKGCVLEGNKIVSQAKNIKINMNQEESLELIKNYTDKELFEMCGGLTAHKGARHGLTMSAKLARLEQQEKAFFDACAKSNCTEYKSEKKKKKLLEESDFSIHSSIEESENISTEFNYGKLKKKKKKNKRREEEDLASNNIFNENKFEESINISPMEEEYSKRTKKRKRKENIIKENNFEDSGNISPMEEEYNESAKKRKRKKNIINEINFEDSSNTSVVDEEYSESTKKRKKKKNTNEINFEGSGNLFIIGEEYRESTKKRKKKAKKENNYHGET